MKRYECVKGFSIDRCDGDGFTVEEGGVLIELGGIWVDQEEDYRLVGGEVRLEIEDESLWIEIPSDMILVFFKEVTI
ncbi:hypothetical protein [Paenibacillus sp. L3-i20]|uniref:hypothetical protein n=1 Tax=Paenibacillus sp. L3-i20 TaxID=2905833 RepID=UPI001EDD3986|nr:hypothetical protein [Paenibacillus sp. L3-i20]GKU80157.1 hypothetical protein L3i20_v245540 [Paenibacillus sp. L3-i20]